MDRKTKILFTTFFLAILIVVGLAYFRFYVLRDYVITSEVDCDPSLESCFVRQCEEDCEEENEITYYKIRAIHASEIPLCDPHQGDCPDVPCNEMTNCEETLCSEATVSEGDECLTSSTEEIQNENVESFPESFSEASGNLDPASE